MTPRQIDVDGLFDRNADTRLLDRRRSEELGLPPVPATGGSSTALRFGPESMVSDGVPIAAPRGPMLRVGLQARPDRELIPGAVVTVVAEVADDGDTDADEVRLRVAIPPETEAVAGSFVRDDVELDGEALLGEGLRVGTVAAAATIRVRFALRVLPGTEPIDLLTYADAPGVPTIAAPALRLTRRTGHVAYDAPRPFFEMESGETDAQLVPAQSEPLPETPAPITIDTVVDEAIILEAPLEAIVLEPAVEAIVVEPALEEATVVEPVIEEALVVEPVPEEATTIEPVVEEATTVESVVDEPLASPVIVEDSAITAIVEEAITTAEVVEESSPAEPQARPDEPRPELEAPPELEPQPELPPEETTSEPVAETEPEPVVAEHLLARAVDADEIRALERVFAGAVPHGLAALALLSSIAAVDTRLGVALGTRDFARSVAAALPRALVAARMSRPTPAVVTPETLAAIRAGADASSAPLDFEGPVMVTRLDDRELDALRAVLGRALDDPFLRGVQVLLAVAPRALEGVAPEMASHARDALTAYRIAAGAWLMRVTVRRAVDRRYDPLTAEDATLHGVGRDLVAALRAAIA
jgi:hypothetical protein